MSKHTPGPWSFWSGYNPYDKIEAQVTAEGGDIVIASYNHLIEEGEANATLMAAAPDLIGACEAFLDLGIEESSIKDWPEILIVIGQIKAATAKARGES